MFKVCKFDNVYVAAIAVVVIAVAVVVIIVVIIIVVVVVVVGSVILSAIVIVCFIGWRFKLGSDQSAGQVWIGSVGHSGSALQEPFQYRYVSVNGCPVSVYYSECLTGIWTISGGKCGFFPFDRYVRVFGAFVGSDFECSVISVSELNLF